MMQGWNSTLAVSLEVKAPARNSPLDALVGLFDHPAHSYRALLFYPVHLLSPSCPAGGRRPSDVPDRHAPEREQGVQPQRTR